MHAFAAQNNKKRLVVLVPGGMSSSTDLARKINQLAVRENRDIHYLMLVEDEAQALTVSRDMATMKAITAGKLLVVETQQVESADWLEALRAVCLPGDVVVCQEEHTVKTGVFRTVPVHAHISALQIAPVHVLSGMYRPLLSESPSLLREFTMWSGFLTIMLVFSWLEFQLSRSAVGFAGKLSLILLLFIAIGALWTWNKLIF